MLDLLCFPLKSATRPRHPYRAGLQPLVPRFFDKHKVGTHLEALQPGAEHAILVEHVSSLAARFRMSVSIHWLGALP